MSIPGPKTITLKAVLELFTGTFCIFVVAVLIWKLGKFFRRFTKEKVIGGGNSPAHRYVKAWYGWVPLKRKNVDRSIVQKCFAKVRQWTTWNSAKNSYCSIWWSSNQRELEACRQDSMRRQRSPTHLRKCKTITANTIRTPYGYSQRQATRILNYCTVQTGKSSSACFLTRKDLVFYISNNDHLAKRNHSFPCLPDLKITFRRVRKRSEASSNYQRPTNHHRNSKNLRALLCSRKYQIWSARMALNVPECGAYSRHRFPVPPGTPRARQPKKANLRGRTSAQITVPLRHLSNWEIRVIDGLDRKLGWLSHQLMPGRKPFHFPLLPNHWLNIRTWIVYDPASRAPIDAKRRFGDTRFNNPSPTPQRPKRKYPGVTRKVANTPRIESWRVAVNQNRKASGLRHLVKRVELYDDSADDPPDGYIDPACWLIRKPPQGHQLSARQNATYYEGGAGWQERLDDWQNIRRGYRIRKAIHEGRANRTRVKQIAAGITRLYQALWYQRQKQQT
ncbi:hypothetical protein BDV24DRAFT_155730 [Aspergillus arachidicola]|uniref:Uncharacterized protein n=1 Tax=Aspergillus arachidicola TaxID=656916 RepID=A0A5N6XW66_9EURO|nr:hypothetical protein BDV24DRAFT_155730 [Aspergillus arachidicola]